MSPHVLLWARVVLSAFGLVSFTLGAIAVFVTENGSGSAVLIMLGGVLFALMLLWDRVDSFELGGTKLRLRAAAADRYAEAERSAAAGDHDEAQRIRAEAQSMMAVAGTLTTDYRQFRGSVTPGPEQTRKMERILRRMHQVAAKESLDRTEVTEWLADGNEEQRASALAVMQVRPDLRDVDTVLQALQEPKSDFEQLHALLVLAAALDTMDAAGRERLGVFLDDYEPRVGTIGRRRQTLDEMRSRLRSEGTALSPGSTGSAEPVAPTTGES